jgi:hypothetical protein
MRPSIPSDHEIMVYQTMAEIAVSSTMYKEPGGKAGIMMKMLAARELGIPPFQAINGGLRIIQGSVEISARMMNAMIRRAGHQITIKEITDLHCTLVGTRHDTGETQESSFSIEDAQKAGLVKPGGGWTKWPKDMCFARALSRLARQLFSDVIGIGYVEGEIQASNTPPVELEEIISEKAIIAIDDESNVQKLIAMFDKEDQFLVMEYVKVVMTHFGWTQSLCVQKFLEEKSLIDKFNTWKSKRTPS